MKNGQIVGVNFTHGDGDDGTRIIFMRAGSDARFYPMYRARKLLDVFGIEYRLGQPVINGIAIDVPLVF